MAAKLCVCLRRVAAGRARRRGHCRRRSQSARCSQEFLGAGQYVFKAQSAAYSETQSASEGLEQSFHLMVRGPAVKTAQMHIGARGLSKSLKKVFQQLHSKVSDAFRFYFCIDYAVGPATEIDGGSCESFIHGHQEVSSAHNAFLRAHGFLH